RAGKIVYLSGPTHRAAAHEWKQGLRLTDILDSLEAIHAQADPEYILVKSIDKNNQISAQSSSLLQALKNPNSAANLELRPRDEIMVFKRDETRTLLLTEMISQLELQASQDQDARIVEINGRVHAPGKYPLEEGMRVSDLIRASGRLQEAAYPLEAELTRFIVKPGKPRQIDHHTVELDKALKGDDKEDLILQPHDFVQIKETPLWTEEELVIVRGEVRFPGRYPIKRGEKLSSLIKRAGGLTSFAYAEGAVFTREQLRIKEQERMDAFASNLEAELATLSLQRSGDPSEMQSAGVANSLLSRLKTTKAAGRMVINLENIVGGRFQPDEDILLRGGDLLVVPSMMQEVTVIGEVFHPTSHLFESGASAEDYIGASGGATRRADPESSYIIRANGSVISAKSGWFSFSPKVMPGDTVVVPLDAEKVSSLKLWTSVTQIFYQLGVAAAAWNTLGVFP
ncbi:MAG: SLBB domain-containing protein, partial [Gammaproteobacteria bacterium]|nr:SLBB domain-containing protein [Gammaproteobacteria bacterium]